MDILACDIQMFRVLIEGPTDMFCYNKAVYKNYSAPESLLRKNHHIIYYNINQGTVEKLICRIFNEDTYTNLADIFTKVMPSLRRGQTQNGHTCFNHMLIVSIKVIGQDCTYN